MKKFISTMLAVILIFSSISCINTSALTTSDEDENKKKIEDNLYYLIQFNQEYFTILGECRPFYSSSVYDLTCELENVVYDDSSTYNDLLNAYDKLLYADYNLIIEVRMAKWTYELSLKEQNYNNWYSDEDWATFVEKRDALKVALDTGLKSKISDAFYDLLYCYNVMTNRYTLKGDVNKDGAVNIIDVTLIQKYLAGEENFTGAQRMLCGDYNYECFNVSAATTIQKYSVGLIEEMPNHNIFISDSNPYESYERRMERTLNFIICPRTTDGFNLIDNGYYDTQFLENYYKYYYIE